MGAVQHRWHEDPAEHRRQAEQWCDEFEANNQKWLKSTIAVWNGAAEQPDISYEEVDTSIIPPRPRLYGLVGAEEIDDVRDADDSVVVDVAGV